ncbi:hypothetical protein DEO72_LG9g1505 [Vigna unguiculata]|uniref:Uncharacterized protein n=1 Tax=Vigna unguiculata TaxID=3917 RepID=A0A4D6N0L1_VIGUN|nr:hypothetical protein DEO72_LG9g1505 [Vigna unguiculata]
MAPPKASRDSKKPKVSRGSSSRAPPIDSMEEDVEFEYDQQKFTSEADARRFLEIMHVGILPERHVNLKFERKALNTFLKTPIFPADRNTPYGDFLNEDKDFEAIAARLCIPGESYVIGVSGTPVRILRKHLNSLAQMWSVLSLRVMLPSSGFQHSSRPYARQKLIMFLHLDRFLALVHRVYLVPHLLFLKLHSKQP